MTEETGREFRVGDQVHRLRPFKGSKGVRAFAIVSSVSDRLPTIWGAAADFEREFRERNVMRITRDLARYRMVEAENVAERLRADLGKLEPAAVAQRRERLEEEVGRARGERAALVEGPSSSDDPPTEEEVEAARDAVKLAEAELRDLDDAPRVRERVERAIEAQGVLREEWRRYLEHALADTDELVVPRAPTPRQVTMAMFPKVFEVAEREATMLLGLVLIPDDDLKEARGGGAEAANQAILEFGERLLEDLEIDEVAELVVTAVEYAVDRYRPRMARLETRVEALGETLTPSQSALPIPTEEEALGPDRRQTEPTVGSAVVEPETSPSRSSDSSTDSPGPTAGE